MGEKEERGVTEVAKSRSLHELVGTANRTDAAKSLNQVSPIAETAMEVVEPTLQTAESVIEAIDSPILDLVFGG